MADVRSALICGEQRERHEHSHSDSNSSHSSDNTVEDLTVQRSRSRSPDRNRSSPSDNSPSTSASRSKGKYPVPVTMPSNSFLLSSLLNMKPGASPSYSPSPDLDQKESGSNSAGGGGYRMKTKRTDGEDTTDDDGVKITYEQIMSKPPRKRICYSMPENFGKCKAGSNLVCAKTTDSASKSSSTTASDEEDRDHSNTDRRSASGSPSPVLPTASVTAAKSTPTPIISAKELQFPIAVRTDEFRRRSSRSNHHHPRPGGPPIPRPRVERYIVASRDIEPGEIILQENPLIAGPISRKSKTLDKSKYCLGCYQHVNGLYKCSKCGWPMCNAKCEKIADHAEFECEVFASNPVSPIVHSSEYEKIKVLRCLLLRDKYPERWNKLLDMDAHNDLRQGNFVAVSQTINIFKFIKQECHLNQFDGEMVNHIVGVCAVNGFPTDGLLTPSSSASSTSGSKMHHHYQQLQQHSRARGGGTDTGTMSSSSNYYVPTNASLLFYNASLITQDCVPNSYTIISKSPARNSSSYLLTVIASQRIKKGQIITHAFVDSTRGTFQRRQQLKEFYYFSCDCRRCSDPSELCTHYSQIKCPKPSCPNGYLYPLNSASLELTGQWYCNYAPRCDFRLTNAQVVELLKHVQYDISKTYVQHSLFQEYENLEAVLDKYKGKVLHPNHFLIMDIQYSIISCINKLLVLVNEEEAFKLATKQIEYCRDCLEIADILHPGSNRIRGNLLFYLHEGMLIIFLGEFKRNINQESFLKVGKAKFEEIIKIMNESKAILINEPEGSPEFQKIKALTMDSANLQPLLEYFGITL